MKLLRIRRTFNYALHCLFRGSTLNIWTISKRFALAAVLMGLFLQGGMDSIAAGKRHNGSPRKIGIDTGKAIFIGKPGTRAPSSQEAFSKSNSNGSALRTPSGIWTLQTSGTPNNLNAALSKNVNSANAVGNGGAIVEVTDGINWTSLVSAIPAIDLLGITMNMNGKGVVVGAGGTIQTTTDGGSTWAVRTSGVTANLNDVASSLNSHYYIAVGNSGTALYSNDDGDTWVQGNSGTTVNLNSLYYANDHLAAIAVGDSGVILVTVDAGITWTRSYAEGITAKLNDISFSGDPHPPFYGRGIAVGGGGTVMLTNDGGANWSAADSGTPANLNGVSFPVPGGAVAAGDNGTIIRSVDSGQNWVLEASGTYERLNDISMFDASTGYAVGDYGTILHTESVLLPNLVVSSFTGPANAFLHDDITSQISLVITNTGDNNITTLFSASLFYRDGTGQSTPLTNGVTSLGSLGVGELLVVHFNSVSIPTSLQPGSGFIDVILDESDQIDEIDENDNVSSFPIIISSAEAACAYHEDFQTGDGGWMPVNLTVQDIYWHQTSYIDSVQTRGVMWCGTDDPAYATPPGYGNGWVQFLTKSFTLPMGTVALDYTMQYDTEAGWDMIDVDISIDGGITFTTLSTYDGSSGGFLVLSDDLSSYAGLNVTIRFTFYSDTGWSDEDGKYDTDGACRIDRIQVTGFPVDDFETGSDGWIASADPGVEGAFRLEESPPCSGGFECDSLPTGEPTCYAWAAYDPNTMQFPFSTDDQKAQNVGAKFAIESPVITIPADAHSFSLEFDVFGDLPLANGVFFSWEVAAPADGPFLNSNYIYFNETGWNHFSYNITPQMTAGATTIKIRLIGWEAGFFFGINPTYHTPAPFFDNVSLIAYASSLPPGGCTGFPRPCGVQAQVDFDNDGVYDTADACPVEDASFFDRDGDGCVDEITGARHIEYWSQDDFPLPYFINQDGAPGISDGSDFTALQASMGAWSSVAGVEASSIYQGPIAQQNADALDQINMITFSDPDYVFPSGVLAVGITTSFTAPADFNGRHVRPGQIVDADMIFNPAVDFNTPSAGLPGGIDIQSVATHEAGHMFGMAHSAVKSSTMFYVLPPGMEAASLEPEDEQTMLKAYPNSIILSSGSRLNGTVKDGATNDPVPGVIVFAINAATSDTVGCDYTLPSDGSFEFLNLADGNYYIAIHALDGSPVIGYIAPGNINDMMLASAADLVTPEYWDAAESNSDDSASKDPVTVSSAAPVSIEIITNIDQTGPQVAESAPSSGGSAVPIDAAVVVSFTEPILDTSISGNFALTDTVANEFIQGSAALVEDDSTLAFIPKDNLKFQSVYKLELKTGITDLFGNHLNAPFISYFTTEPQPPVGITDLVPNKGVAGSVCIINGFGFDADLAQNLVSFGADQAAVTQASATQLVVNVPPGVQMGSALVTINNLSTGEISNSITFSVLSTEEAARGFEVASIALNAIPYSAAVSPDGVRSFVATDAGVSVITTEPGPNYLSLTTITVPGGVNELDVTPDGGYLIAASKANKSIYRINANPNNGPLSILSENSVGAVPQGILVLPSGDYAMVTTDNGKIQMWDIRQGSPMLDRQVGFFSAPEPDQDLREKMAVDPAESMLFALSGSGKLLVFDINNDSLLASADLGTDPQDIVIDAAGSRAYVSDGTGLVTLVSLSGLAVVGDIKTSGTLRGIDISPAGKYLYTANYERNFLDIIDLRQGAPTFHSVAAQIPQKTNPVDVILSPDGVYAYSLVQQDQMFIVNAIGLGPVVNSVSPLYAPIGSKVVFSGSKFTADLQTNVSFGGVAAAPERLADGSLTVTVPAGAANSNVVVIGSNPNTPDNISNAVHFNVLGATSSDLLRRAAGSPSIPPSSGASGGAVLTVSPAGDFAALADMNGGVHILDTSASSTTFNQYIGSFTALSAVTDIAVDPAGLRAFLLEPASGRVQVINVNRYGTNFLTETASIDLSAVGGIPSKLAVSPDGAWLLASNPDLGQIHIIDIAPGSPLQYQISGSTSVFTTLINGRAGEMAFHPGGTHAYVPIQDTDPAVVVVIDMNPANPTFQQIAYTLTLPGTAPQEIPIALSFTPDGSLCLVLTRQDAGSSNRSVVMLDTSSPAAPSILGAYPLGTFAVGGMDDIDVSPRGDRVIASIAGGGLFNYSISTAPAALSQIGGIIDSSRLTSAVESAYFPGAVRFYSVSQATEDIVIYDFSTAQSIAALSGNNQAGIIMQPLAAPLKVRVSAAGSPEGIPVVFNTVSGGGVFSNNGMGSQTVLADANGDAAVDVTLGPAVGQQTVEASSAGLAGSPIVFIISALDNPDNLPLQISSTAPVQAQIDAAVSTAIQTIFTRSVDPSTANAASFFLRETLSGLAVPSVMGFSNQDRKISLTPVQSLKHDIQYSIFITQEIKDMSGGVLSNPDTVDFTTSALPPPTITAVSPPSAVSNVGIVISGSGFDPVLQNNSVSLSGIPAVVTNAGSDHLNVTVPNNAVSGPIIVTVADQISNPFDFIVIEPPSAPVESTVDAVQTPSPARSIAITPDGKVVYGVSPDADAVVVVNINTLTQISSIPVGDNPTAIAIHPDGNYAYVTNFYSGTVSILDIVPASLTYNKEVKTLFAGTNPVDIDISPAGDRLIIADMGSDMITTIDTNNQSATFHEVLAKVKTGSKTRSVAITPDGGRLYLGTDDGYIVMEMLDFGVVAKVKTGSATRSVSITPDGTLAVLLTNQGEVLLIDIVPGSRTENQVVASAKTGSKTRRVAISPDGSFLYLVQEDNNEILVFLLKVGSTVSVIDPDASSPPTELTLLATITAGENPSDIAFDPSGSGTIIVSSPGNNLLIVLGPVSPVTGRVYADCPAPETGLTGVEIDAYREGSGDLADIVTTDSTGSYSIDLAAGDYVMTVITPLGYSIETEESLVTVSSNDTVLLDFPMTCETIIPKPKKMSYWKHELAEAVEESEHEDDEKEHHHDRDKDPIDAALLCGYLDKISSHFNSNKINPVVVYQPPVSDLCEDKLIAARNLMKLKSGDKHASKAKQELMALLLNVSSGKLALRAFASKDNITIGQAITYIDSLIDDALTGGMDEHQKKHDLKIARNIAKTLNKGKLVNSGVIPPEVPDIVYYPHEGRRFNLEQNFPNPFNPITAIRYEVPNEVDVRLSIYDVTGRLVKTLVNSRKKTGIYTIKWNGRNERGEILSSGVYFYRLIAGDYKNTRKMVLLK